MLKKMRPSKQEHRVLAGVSVQLTRKRIKNINMRVNSSGEVRISAPYHVPLYVIEEFVASRLTWIEQAKEKVSTPKDDRFQMTSAKEQAKWKATVQAFVPPLIEKWEKVLGVQAGTLAYRNMKSRWGSCQPSTGRICINTRLACYPPECLEYVVVHELCHLLEKGHGPAFYALLDSALPEWRSARARLKD